MIIRIKKGQVQVDMTRKEMKKRGFRFRVFADDPQKFGIALMAIRVAYIADEKEGGRDGED